MSRSGVHLGLYNQSNPTPSLRSALGKPQWRQQASSHVTACQTKHVCSDVRTCGGGVIYFDVKANVATSHLQKMLSFKIILYGTTIMIIILFDLNLGKALEIRSDRKD